jgi:hypothetical protein
MTLEVVEVITRAVQGHTRPFVCRCSDDQIYFVKGLDAGRRSQLCEWLAGRLAQLLGLPVAPFAIVHVPPELLAANAHAESRQLGAGPAFGSLRSSVTELTLATLSQIPAQLQSDVLVFDRWVRNHDRSLSSLGGNPNLFIEPPDHSLVMIDHNLAFDPAFDLHELLGNHVFRAQAGVVAGDLVVRANYNARLFDALGHWQQLLAEIPQEWWYLDAEQTMPTNFDLALAFEWLSAYQTDAFWQWR